MSIDRAISAVRGGMPVRQAARMYSIPKSTLHDRVKELVNNRCVVYLCDLHAPYLDRRALDIAIEYCHRHFRPTWLVLGGDTADLFEFSRFSSTPRQHPDEEIMAVRGELANIADAFSGCRKTFLMGNHERRLIRYVQNEAPKLARLLGATIPSVLDLDAAGYEFHDNHESWERDGTFFKIGKLTYLHGDEIGGCGYLYTAQRMAEKYRANVIYGHLHASDCSRPVRDLDGHIVRTWQVGCLHTRTPHYRPGASHNLGFAVVEYDGDGSGCFTVHNMLLDDNYKVRR